MSEQDLISQLTEQLREATELVHSLRGLSNRELAGLALARRALLLMKTSNIKSQLFELPLEDVEELSVRLLKLTESPMTIFAWLTREKHVEIDYKVVCRFANSFLLAVRELIGVAKPRVRIPVNPLPDEGTPPPPNAHAGVILDWLASHNDGDHLMSLDRGILRQLVDRLLADGQPLEVRRKAARWLRFKGLTINPRALYRFAKSVEVARRVVAG